MDSKDELKETDIKYRTCYYFDDIMRVIKEIFYWTKNHMKIFQFMTFHTKISWVENYCAFGSKKY